MQRGFCKHGLAEPGLCCALSPRSESDNSDSCAWSERMVDGKDKTTNLGQRKTALSRNVAMGSKSYSQSRMKSSGSSKERLHFSCVYHAGNGEMMTMDWQSLDPPIRNHHLYAVSKSEPPFFTSVVLTAFSLTSNSEGQRTIPENCSKM